MKRVTPTCIPSQIPLDQLEVKGMTIHSISTNKFKTITEQITNTHTQLTIKYETKSKKTNQKTRPKGKKVINASSTKRPQRKTKQVTSFE